MIMHTPGYSERLAKSTTRKIDWHRGFPYTWGGEERDFELLENSAAVFARKFSPDKMDIVNKLYDELMRRKGDEMKGETK